MWELVKAGGWLMLPLILCSIFMVAISIERFLRLKRNLVLPEHLMITKATDLNLVTKDLNNPHMVRTCLSTILKSGLDSASQGEAYARAQMEATASKEVMYLEKNVNFLGTISAVAPLLGLLGTVVGIIESFLMLDVSVGTNPTMMIPGLSKALITTAAGMVVAIPALFAFRYFQRLVQEYIAELEQQSTLFHAALFYQNHTEANEQK
ncbi:MAG: MotA/TolQ/ExbB proton channel family protein [Acinetobacter sp.]|nr:MotA/TolQ/ExbB proton channel family protein [Acinetobacter sp.]